MMRYGDLWKKLCSTNTSFAHSSEIHGPLHWRQVYRNGIYLARHTGADIALVELFSLFHDSCRLDDGKDPEHGIRAAEFIVSMRADLGNLSDELFQCLVEAIRDHVHVKHAGNIHVATCWDADRLDLGRVGIVPDEAFMNTETGRTMARGMASGDGDHE